MVSTLVECDECGVGGLDSVKDACGDWLGTPDNGYRCPDVICSVCKDYDVDEDEDELDIGTYS